MRKKKIDDIDLDSVDLSKHTKVIPSGTKLYRIVLKGIDPLKPTGKENRFASEPPGYTFEKYQAALQDDIAIITGTGSTSLCTTVRTARLEIGSDWVNRETYKITLISDIEIVDMDSICEAERIYERHTGERTGIWHEFYGKKIKGLRYRSSKNPDDYNIVIFPDWFKEFHNIVKVEKINTNI